MSERSQQRPPQPPPPRSSAGPARTPRDDARTPDAGAVWGAAGPDPDIQPGDESWPGLASAFAEWPEAAEIDTARFIPVPQKQLDPKARTLWIINNLLGVAVFVVIAVAVMVALHRWRDVGMLWTVGIPVVIAAVGIAFSWVDAVVRYRVWRYEIRSDEVDLLHGLVTRQRQLVPMARIQHVDTRQGPLERRYGLASVLFFTAAGGMEIPALSVEHAAEVRNQIAALAKVHDDL